MLSLVERIETDDIPINWLNPTRILPIIIPKPINSFAGDQINRNRQVRLKGLIEIDGSDDSIIPIPALVRQLYADVGRPTRLTRAKSLMDHYGCHSVVLLKREDLLPTFSFKLNTAIAQAYCAYQEGIQHLVTETGTGQWELAMAYACSYFDIRLRVYWAKISQQQKQSRYEVLRLLGADVFLDFP